MKFWGTVLPKANMISHPLGMKLSLACGQLAPNSRIGEENTVNETQECYLYSYSSAMFSYGVWNEKEWNSFTLEKWNYIEQIPWRASMPGENLVTSLEHLTLYHHPMVMYYHWLWLDSPSHCTSCFFFVIVSDYQSIDICMIYLINYFSLKLDIRKIQKDF